MAETRVYRRRHPERTDDYRVTESRFEELERMWPDCFEQKYGYPRRPSSSQTNKTSRNKGKISSFMEETKAAIVL